MAIPPIFSKVLERFSSVEWLDLHTVLDALSERRSEFALGAAGVFGLLSRLASGLWEVGLISAAVLIFIAGSVWALQEKPELTQLRDQVTGLQGWRQNMDSTVGALAESTARRLHASCCLEFGERVTLYLYSGAAGLGESRQVV